MSVTAGLPAELPKFCSKRPLGDVAARSLQDADDDIRSTSSPVAGAGVGEAVTSATCSANDSSMLDSDMDETC